MPQPELPAPAHPDLDSMLSRKFGREVANYFGGSPLNRVSFLRANHDFISQAFVHPTTHFLLLNNLAPLTKDPSQLAYATHSDISTLTGPNPFEKTEEVMIKEYNSSITLPLVLFLGLDERNKQGFSHGIYSGTPYFAIDVTPKGTYEKEASSIVAATKEKGLHFQEGRVIMSLGAPEAAIFAQARALLDWNARNPFCGGCGQPTLSVSFPNVKITFPRITNAHGILGQCRHQTSLSANRLRIVARRSSRHQPCCTKRETLMCYPKRYLQSLFPPYRPHCHHGRSKPRRQTSSPRTPKALASILVQRASRVLRARRISRRSGPT